MPRIRDFRLNNARRGTIICMLALLLVVIVGMMAIALDGGMLLDEHKQVQSAADAAALAAAAQLFVHYPAIEASGFTIPDPNGAALAAALASAATNGFPNNGVSSTVVVNLPPATGPFKGIAAYVEVIITYNEPRYFSSIWGSTTTPVVARAVARGRWAASKDGIFVLDPTSKDSLDSTGTAALTVSGGSRVIVDSNYGPAATVSGGGSITASEYDVTGTTAGTFNGTVITGTPPQPDPLRYLPVPTMPPNGTITVTNLGGGGKQYVLTPGTYTNLPNFTSSDSVILQQASANTAGGIYYINGGGFTSTGASITMDPLTTGGVMIYNSPTNSSNSQGINISGNSSGTVNLSAPTTGPYAGILFFQDRTANQTMSVTGGGNFSLTGTFYTAGAQLKVTGGGNATIGSQYISKTLVIAGNGNITIDYSEKQTGRVREVILVE
jgi:hypothetical protein